DAQVLADAFLSTVRSYLRRLVADLRAYSVTEVQAGGDEGGASGRRTSILLKEAWVESFPAKDRPFMKGLAETQLFAVYVDSVLGG
ncbi:hypothetical protein H632_c2427p0, partial [Helicosporidium sp. ATCC 50920]